MYRLPLPLPLPLPFPPFASPFGISRVSFACPLFLPFDPNMAFGLKVLGIAAFLTSRFIFGYTKPRPQLFEIAS